MSPSVGLTWSENQTLECPERSSPSSTQNINSDQEKVSRPSPRYHCSRFRLGSQSFLSPVEREVHFLRTGVSFPDDLRRWWLQPLWVVQWQGIALYFYAIKTGLGIGIIVAFGSAAELHWVELHPCWRTILVGIALGVLFTDFLYKYFEKPSHFKLSDREAPVTEKYVRNFKSKCMYIMCH